MFNNFQVAPKQLKYFLVLVGVFSLLPCILNSLAPLFGLSLAGLVNIYFWQPLTFLFMQPNILEITFNSILQLIIYIFAIYTAGLEIISRKKIKSFYILFFLPGIISASFLIGAMYLFKISYVIFGLAIPTYSLLTAYVMLNSNAKILLFHAMPIKISNIISAIFGIHIFLIAANSSIIIAFAHLLAVFFTYLYCLKIWKVYSPFTKFKNFESVIIGKVHKAKFYNFTTKSDMSNEEVIDEILDNSKSGLSEKDKKKINKLFRKK